MMPTTMHDSTSRIGRVDQRRDRLPLHPRHHFDVGDVPADDLLEAAALFAGQQRRRVDARKQRPVRLERLRQRAAPPHPLVHVVQHGLEERVRDPLPQDVERLHERHAGLEQRRQLLVEDRGTPASRCGRASASSRRAEAPRGRRAGWPARTGPFPRTRASAALRSPRRRRLRRSRRPGCRACSGTPCRYRRPTVVSAQGLVCVDIIGRSIRKLYNSPARHRRRVLTAERLRWRIRQGKTSGRLEQFERCEERRRLLEAGERQDAA